MPYRRKIAGVERAIEEVRASLDEIRSKDKPAADKLLGELARLRAERLRLMQCQRLVSNGVSGTSPTVSEK
jgi:hypothetical protein